MEVPSSEGSKRLAEQNGWSLAFAQGHVDGANARRLGNALTGHARVAIDEYSLGFRAGYFERQHIDAPVTADPKTRRDAAASFGPRPTSRMI